jgi:hypothetical protein
MASKPTTTLANADSAKPAVPTAGPAGPRSVRLKWDLRFFALALVASIGVFGYLDRPTVLAIAAPTLLVAMAFTQIDRFKTLKGAGFEAELAEVKEATDEAKATVEQLRAIATSTAKITLDLLGSAGRMGAIPTIRRFALKAEIEASLRGIGVLDDAIQNAGEQFKVSFSRDHVNKVLETATLAIKTKTAGDDVAARALQEAWNATIKDVGDAHIGRPWSPSSLRDALKARDLLTPEANAALLDYEHFLASSTLRRVEAWANG